MTARIETARKPFPERSVRRRVLGGLRHAFERHRPEALVDHNGYVRSVRDNVLALVTPEDFETDFRSADGNELELKFRAVHSSSALAVNCFAPFRSRISDLRMPRSTPFERLQFERKCPTGLRGGRSPNLDVVLSGPADIVAIESKLTEYLGRHRARFSPAYSEQIRDERREQGYFQEMLRLLDEPDGYARLDAAQLIKHAFGLARTFADTPATLLYLYWEPANPECSPIFDEHRREIADFAARVAGSTPRFEAMSYAALWSAWQQSAPRWLARHLAELRARYLITL